jgi:hypothetical protein
MSVNNTKYGSASLNNNSGSNNTAIGAYAAYNNLDGTNNTAVGSNSSYYNTSGVNNTALGAGSLCNNETGSLNTAVGSSALEGVVGNTTGDQNVAVGAQALYVNSGNLNTAIGTYAGENVDSSYNTFLGANTSFDNTSATYEYSTAIGYNAQITSSNQIMIGGTGSNQYPDVVIPGNGYLPNFDILTATNDQIVTKEYVDSVSQGLTPKAPCTCVATAGVTITQGGLPATIDVTTPFTTLYIIDGYPTQVGNRVLINDQTPDIPTIPSTANPNAAILNGIYVVTGTPGSYSWVRSADMQVLTDALGAYCFVEFGLTYKATSWIQQTTDSGNPVYVGTDSLYFIKYGALPFRIGRGLDTFASSIYTYLEVDTSLNFVNYLDSVSGAAQPGGATGGSGTLNIGTGGTTNVIIGPTGPSFGNLVQFPSGLTGATGSFSYLSASQQISAPGGITGTTGSFTYLNSVNNALINGVTVGRGTDNSFPVGTNTIFGYNAMQNLTLGSTYSNTAVGFSALQSDTSGSNNTAVGSACLQDNTTGINNTGVGSGTLQDNTTGNNNTGVGLQALYANTIGIGNTALGSLSLFNVTSGNNNTAVGFQSLVNKLQGSNNTALGNSAGLNDVSGNFNTYLGANTNVSSSSVTYQYSTAIGYGAVTTASNQIMLGGNGAGSYPQVVATGGITGATGSFTYLSASQGISVLAGITGATGSFTYLSASQQISAPGGITGATGSFTYLSASQGLIGNSTGLAGGSQNSIPYQSSPSITSFIPPPTSNAAILTYNGTSIGWTGLTGLTGSTKWISSGNNIYNNNTGNVGIGTINPSFNLDVSGNLRATGGITGPTGSFTNITVSGPETVQGLLSAPGGITGTTGSFTYLSASQGITGPTGSFSNVFVSGNVGIGKSNPGNTLDVSGNLNVDGFMNGVINNPGFNFLPLDISNNFALNWSKSSDISANSVSVSASGQYQTATFFNAVTNSGSIYISSNYGVSWSQPSSIVSDYYFSVSVSASGQYQTAVTITTSPGTGSIYNSNDYGVTWSLNSFVPPFAGIQHNSVSVSASGQYQTAVITVPTNPATGSIYNSNDYGVTWSLNSSATVSYLYTSVSMSATGQYQTATFLNGGGGNLYISSNYGVTWSDPTISVSNSYSSVSMSATGQYQTAVTSTPSGGGNPYISSNYGDTWSYPTSAPISSPYSSVSISATGQLQVAASSKSQFGYIAYSTNYGVDWSYSITTIPYNVNNGTRSVSMSPSGQYITVVTSAGGIYKSVLPITISGLLSAPGGITGATGSFNYLYSANTVTASDYRIKENVTPLNNTYVVDELIPVTYTNKITERQDMGLIAHELQEVFPFLVNGEKDGKDYQSVNYTGLIPLLIKEVKELKEKVKKIEDKLNH